MEPSPYSERFTIACNHSQEPAGGGSGFWVPAEGCSRFWVPAGGGSRCCTVRRPASNQLVFPLYGPMPRCRTNGGMAKDPGASLQGGLAQHNAYLCHRQAKAFRFTLLLLRLPTGASLLVEHPHAPARPSYNFACFKQSFCFISFQKDLCCQDDQLAHLVPLP